MAGHNGTMSRMAKKKTANDSQGKPTPGRHKHPIVGLRIPSQLMELMRELARENRRPITTQLAIALEEHLAKNGKWPPPEPSA